MTNKNLGSTIIELSNQGLSYNQIRDKLNCSKGTISYHLGKDQKRKTRTRATKYKNKHPFISKLSHFKDKSKTYNKCIILNKNNLTAILNRKILDFCKILNESNTMTANNLFTLEDVLNKIGPNPKCALSGVDIDINKPSTYQFDHIVPRNRGGNNSLENLQITTKIVNQAKRDMTQDEFINLCRLVVENNSPIY